MQIRSQEAPVSGPSALRYGPREPCGPLWLKRPPARFKIASGAGLGDVFGGRFGASVPASVGSPVCQLLDAFFRLPGGCLPAFFPPPERTRARYNRHTMKDIYEAIERMSAQLSYRLERVAQKKGFAVHYSGYNLCAPSGQIVKVFHSLVHLPRGYGASFVPRPQPEPDGESWHIDIRRNDGVSRSAWLQGLTMRKSPAGEEEEWTIYMGGEPLHAERIAHLYSELEKPGPSGLHLAITRMWIMRFGRMPFELAQALESITHVDHLDLIYDALLDQRKRALIEELLHNPPPAHSPARYLASLPRD